MNLDELRSVQAKERRKDSLQHLRNAFYDDVAAYIADLRAARDRRAEQVENPFSDDDVRRMSDEIETAEEVAEALYERRVGKVVKLASFAAADMPVETEGMTSQEQALFDDLVSRIGDNKSAVLDALSGEVAPGSTASPNDGTADPPDVPDDVPDAPREDDVTRSSEDPEGTLANAMGGSEDPSNPDPDGSDTATPTGDAANSEPSAGRESADEPTRVDPEPAPPGAFEGGGSDVTEDSEGVANDGAGVADDEAGVPDDVPDRSADRPSTNDTARTTVRITQDVGSILGVDDREYDLASEDVVTLPAENAEPLVRRDAAERLE